LRCLRFFKIICGFNEFCDLKLEISHWLKFYQCSLKSSEAELTPLHLNQKSVVPSVNFKIGRHKGLFTLASSFSSNASNSHRTYGDGSLTCLSELGQNGTTRNVPISVVPPKDTKVESQKLDCFK